MAFLDKAKRKFKYIIPTGVKKAMKYCLYSLQDFWSFVTGKGVKGYPPKRLNFVGSGEFMKIGEEFLKHFKKIGGLKSSNTVLDIGSGIGRMAIPLARYLDTNKGEYYGFDIDKRGVKWCKNNVSIKYPHFNFEYVDIYNKYYNKKGKIKANKFVFPYKNEMFDFVFATSVFTHMLPDQIEQYLSEIKRVLKPGGKIFLTFFSLDKEAIQNIKKKISYCDFGYTYDEAGNCMYSHKDVPEAEIGYKEKWIIDQLKKSGISEELEIYHGGWSGRKNPYSYQDIICAQKK
ncbi:SAM-dependent methyltransferase [bacterium]|nr:SAM-dependent methyltransferase [bacterium]